MNKRTAYQQAGVNISAGYDLVNRIKPRVAKTYRPEVLTGLGGFGGCFELDLSQYQKPVLVSGTDGVGTKLKLAFDLQQHDSVGIDLVAMCVNDILTCGAEPLYFLDYFATSQLDVDTASLVIEGICHGCQIANMALLGGETAEMPGFYQGNDYDIAGFCVGIVEKSKMITGETIRPGDVLIGLAASGLHSNGFSLVRKILDDEKIDLSNTFDNSTFADVLLSPTRIYVPNVLPLLQELTIKGMSHITGGGLIENIPRMLPPHVKAIIHQNAWEQPSIFSWLAETGHIEQNEMYNTFNCGIGFVLCVPQEQATQCLTLLETSDCNAWEIGFIEVQTETASTLEIK